MNLKPLVVTISILAFPASTLAADTGFLEGEAQEVIVKVRTADGKYKWYRVMPDGTRKEMEMKPGDRFEFLYEDSVDLDAITVRPKKE
ncbi:MAG TPA: hypothetical protein ENI96_03695 [Sedimenticola thiotaurini]|uniref:Uncharacterized protein n=1 Tax=Sedimenticola thiotaurini TaxID=1543721 RepID=A0A831RM80_9GAMM|nr:hypothetical protein [Sedimenticola thiotaurini]